jgi:hypothetical protein
MRMMGILFVVFTLAGCTGDRLQRSGAQSETIFASIH